MDYQVVLSRSARSDIKDIVRYISFDDPQRALNFGRYFIQHARSLEQFPLRGRVVPEFDGQALRELIIKAYRIVYRVSHVSRRSRLFVSGTPVEIFPILLNKTKAGDPVESPA